MWKLDIRNKFDGYGMYILFFKLAVQKIDERHFPTYSFVGTYNFVNVIWADDCKLNTYCEDLLFIAPRF